MNAWIKKTIKKIFLDRIPPGTAMPMLGANRGRRWIIGSGNHGHWLGRSEPAVQTAFRKHIKKGDVVYDIGAHAGFYTLLAAKLVGPQGRIYAFEPLKENFENLTEHLRLNNVENARAYPVAVSSTNDKVRFEKSGSTYTGHISQEGEIEVRTVSIDSLIEKQEILPPDFVKIDVEGHELDVLKGMSATLEKKRDVIIELEANFSRMEVLGFLKDRGYVIKRLDPNNVVCVRK